MSLPLAGLILILIALIGGTMAMVAFIWAVRTKQFKDLNAGAYVIFDEEEPVGKMTDNTFGFPESEKSSRKGKGKYESRP
ncbi:MAG TPA: cbb3-type cytochrome oxidase assembly protein CcoS [Thermodesulfobacteriota bacterium]|nr:cbb3-type cytochrome oxidase assembly protein CcoS [Thermodesulfobacteriota bacterium]